MEFILDEAFRSMGRPDDVEAKLAMKVALQDGFKASGLALVLAGTAVSLANNYSPKFRNSLGISGKIGLVTMAGIGTFAARTETSLLQSARNPLSKGVAIKRRNTSTFELSPMHKAANWVYDHPFRFIGVVGSGIVGGIFFGQSRDATVKFSQRVMHSRIYGQLSVVALLLGTMAFHDWMETHGRFVANDNHQNDAVLLNCVSQTNEIDEKDQQL